MWANEHYGLFYGTPIAPEQPSILHKCRKTVVGAVVII